MIRWTFYFDQGNVSSDVYDEESDLEMDRLISSGEGLVYLPGSPEIYVNLDHVKAITREPVIQLPPQALPVTDEVKEIAACLTT